MLATSALGAGQRKPEAAQFPGLPDVVSGNVNRIEHKMENGTLNYGLSSGKAWTRSMTRSEHENRGDQRDLHKELVTGFPGGRLSRSLEEAILDKKESAVAALSPSSTTARQGLSGTRGTAGPSTRR